MTIKEAVALKTDLAICFSEFTTTDGLTEGSQRRSPSKLHPIARPADQVQTTPITGLGGLPPGSMQSSPMQD